MTPDLHADAIVVGAGHNGLVAAAYLADAGLRVTVAERRRVVGGACVTEELAPGFRVSSGAYSLSLLRPDIHAALRLHEHGLRVIPKDPMAFVPLPDGGHFFVWRDEARTREELARIHPKDADAYPRWNAFWDHAASVLRPLVEHPDPPDIDGVRHRVGDDVWRLAVAGSAARTVASFFEAPPIQGHFASQGIIGTFAGVRQPGTAWVMAYHALGGEVVGAAGAWGYVRGGMGAVTEAIASAARACGARILTDAAVAEILIDDDAATGVRLHDGRLIRAPIVVSGADPKTTFLRLLPSGSLDETFAARVSAWPTPGSVMKVNLALTEPPEYIARPGSLGSQHRGTTSIAPSVDYLQDAFDEAHAGRPSSRPFMELFLQSAVDDTLAPEGCHVLSAFTQYAPADRWDDVREAALRNVIDTIASYAPNVRDAILHAEVLGPPDLETRFGLAGGNIFHGEMLPEHSFGNRFAYRTPVAGLYLCGSGARPGGAVMGAAGRNAAGAILADLAEKGRTS